MTELQGIELILEVQNLIAQNLEMKLVIDNLFMLLALIGLYFMSFDIYTKFRLMYLTRRR